MHTANNTHTWGEVQLHRVAWDSMFEVPQVLLGKRATTALLSKNPVCQLQSKGE